MPGSLLYDDEQGRLVISNVGERTMASGFAQGVNVQAATGTALNANGTPIKLSAREWTNTFVAKSKAGNLIIFQKRGRQIAPLYVLEEQGDYPATSWPG